MRLSRGVLLALFVASIPALTASAQHYYLELQGIPGESVDPTHIDWIDVLQISHGIINPIVVGGDGGSSQPIHNPILIRKNLDSSTPLIIQALNEGDRIELAVFEEDSMVGEFLETTLRIELQGVYFSSYSLDGFGEGPMLEQFTMLYEYIRLTYWPIVDGKLGPKVEVEWNVLTGGTPLAAVMSGVDVLVDGRDVVFRWKTLSESGQHGFEIQRREDGEFRRAAYVPAAGWSSQPLEYEVRIRGLEEGIHVFRLASLDLGGTSSYSRELTVSLGVPEGRMVTLDAPYPNPMTDRAEFGVATARDAHARIAVYDMLGREVAVVHEGIISSGPKRHFTLAPSHPLPSGTYFLRVETEAGTQAKLISVTR